MNIKNKRKKIFKQIKLVNDIIEESSESILYNYRTVEAAIDLQRELLADLAKSKYLSDDKEDV